MAALATAALPATSPRPLGAQERAARDTAASAAPADTLTPLAPLVVRVLRWPLPVTEVPAAVSTVDAELRAPSVRLGLGQVLTGVPGLQADNRYNPALGDRIVVRGFGARAQFGVRGVAIRVDGIPATMPDGQSTLNHLDLSELAGAEVVRGPASVLYGNAAGGALLLETVPPPARGRRGGLSATTGTGGLVRLGATAAAGGPGGAWRVTARHERLDGFREFSSSESWNATGRARTRLGGGDLAMAAHVVDYDARNPGGLTAEELAADPQKAAERNVAQGTGEQGRHVQAGAVWRRTLGAHGLEAAVYGLRRSVDNPIPPVVIDLVRHAAGARFLVRSGDPGDGGRSGDEEGGPAWAFGAEAAGQWDTRKNFTNEGGRRGERVLDQGEHVLNGAAFGQVLFAPARPLHVFAAARWDLVTFSADDHRVGPGDPDDSGRRTMSAVSPSVGLTLEGPGGVSLFADVGTSFQTPTTTELVNRPDGGGGFNPDLDPERTVEVEVGARTRRWVGPLALRGELAAYRAEVTDALVPFEVPSAPGRTYFRNAGAARHTGLEAALTGRLPDTEVTASLTLVRAEFRDYTVDDEVYDGLRVPGIRPWTLELGLRQELPGDARLVVDWRATGAMRADDANTVRVGGYRRTSVSLAAPAVGVGGVRVAPYAGVENLFDARYAASVVVNAFGGRYFEPAPGRILFVGLRSEL